MDYKSLSQEELIKLIKEKDEKYDALEAKFYEVQKKEMKPLINICLGKLIKFKNNWLDSSNLVGLYKIDAYQSYMFTLDKQV